MPMYVYEAKDPAKGCERCRGGFEITQSIKDDKLTKCPDCGAEIEVFGKSKAEEVAREFGIPVLGRMPIDPKLSALVDRGVIELMENDYLEKAADAVEAFCEKK